MSEMEKIEPLNHSRQLVKWILAADQILPEMRARASSVVDLHGLSTKFILPDGGRLYDDLELKALDESVRLSLPYPHICLEYVFSNDIRSTGVVGFVNGSPQYEPADTIAARKRVIYAREVGEIIVVTIAFFAAHDGIWRILPECAIPATGYLDRTTMMRGRPAIKVAFEDLQIPMSDYMDEVGALLCFLNLLQCSNVRVDRREPKKTGKKIKAALPFDAYHILTIDAPTKSGAGVATGGHRSPREHLRRGHIRRLTDGRRIWVNAAVVAAGRGAGVISKDYAIKAAP